MLDAILAVWIMVEAIRRKCHRLIPVGILVLLYEAADVGWIRVSEIISMEGTIKKLILMVLVVFVFLAWRKKQARFSAVAVCILALLGRMAWSPVFDRYLDALRQPEANYLALIAQGMTTKMLFGVLTEAMLFVMLVLLVFSLRKSPLKQKEDSC